MRSGIYPIVERDEDGWRKSNGRGLALFDIGDRYNPMTAIVRTLAVDKSRGEHNPEWRTGPYAMLEGKEDRPRFLYVNKKLHRAKKARGKFYIDNFLNEGQEFLYLPFIFDSRINHEQIIETVRIEDIEKYDPKKEFRNWEIKLGERERYQNGRSRGLDLENFIRLARQFANLGEGR